MKPGIVIGIVLFSVIGAASCAQTKYGIRKADAFFSEHLPGNIRADSDGNPVYQPPDTIYTIYLETYGDSIKWIAAWRNGQSFSVIATIVTGLPPEIGKNKQTKEKIVLMSEKGDELWLLQLNKSESSTKPPVSAAEGAIILKGKSGNKTIIHVLNSQTELTIPPSV